MDSATIPSTIPDHVPAELVWSHDFEAFALAGTDPFRRLAELHNGPDILWATNLGTGLGGQPGWLLTRYALMREVLTDTAHFVSGRADSLMSAIGIDWPLIPLELDPPQHQLYRKVLEPFFSPANVNALDGAIRMACKELIADFAEKDSCEFASEFGEKFPSYVFLDLMGMPRERLHDFLTWERNMLRASSPEVMVEAMTAILHYLEDFLREQAQNPGSELMKAMFAARLDGDRKLTETEMLSICYMLYIGGLDTVYATLGWIFWHLAQDQALQDRLHERPEDMTRAIEELLRAFSAASTGRQVKADMEFHGVPMRAGDRVLTYLPLAARDPRAYEDPHRVDIDRTMRHIAFGTGTHTCLGLRIAKREIRIVLESFLSSFRNIRMTPGAGYKFRVGSVFGIDELQLQWERRAT